MNDSLMARQSKFSCFLPHIIFLISLVVHLSLISQGPVTIDCLDLALKSRELMETGRFPFLFGTGYPALLILGSLFQAVGLIFGLQDPVYAVNLIAVVFSSLAVVMFYILVAYATDTLTALAAAFLLLFNPIFLDVSTYGINHAPALFFLLSGLFCLVRSRDGADRRMFFVSGLCLGLMAATRLQDLVLTSPVILAVVLNGWKEAPLVGIGKRLRLLGGLALVVAAVAGLFHLPYLLNGSGGYHGQLLEFIRSGMTENFKGALSHSLKASVRYFLLAFSWVGAAGWLAGALILARVNPRLFWVTLLWWVAPLFFYGNLVTTAPRFFAVMLPGFILPLSVLLGRMARQQRLVWKITAGVVFVVVAFQPLGSVQGTFLRRHQVSLIAEFYSWIGEVTPPDARVIGQDDSIFIQYYAKRPVIGRPLGARRFTSAELQAFRQQLDQALDSGVPVYITTVDLHIYDYYQDFASMMQTVYSLEPVGERPLELWYETPFNPFLGKAGLLRVQKRSL
ncbi:MAG: phospholipid carrier-dependent glycosyltransferase [Candidatus Omnitrophica bacterium]|nr:phospholipid carrier-dependent glycosyltransferase [Candidatus Omnitrophota bacterium]